QIAEGVDAVKLVAPPRDRDLAPGDLPLYRSGERTILHRVVEVRPDHYLIRGDNCFHFERIPKNRVVAVADGFFRAGKYVPNDDPEYRKYVAETRRAGAPLVVAEQRFALRLFVAALTETPPPAPPPELDWRELFRAEELRELAGAAALALERSPAPPSEDILRPFREKRLRDAEIAARAEAEWSEIERELNALGIASVRAGAAAVAREYPAPGARELDVFDVLVGQKRRKELRNRLQSLGFGVVSSRERDVFRRSEPRFVFHYSLRAPGKNRPRNGALPAASAENIRSNHPLEDAFADFVATTEERFREERLGPIAFGDAFIFYYKIMTQPGFDAEYLRAKLQEENLVKVEERLRAETAALFATGEFSSDEIARRIFVGGARERRARGTETPPRSVWRRIFPRFQTLRAEYRVLRKFPAAAPIFYLIRPVSRVFSRKFAREAAALFRGKGKKRDR
ncbi:MAG: nucleotidyltransferase family protein, partial [Thermoguttaceae bacterium]|nr:nucleotidyltransferase family protein [Thermoguttaceae bacterium]